MAWTMVLVVVFVFDLISFALAVAVAVAADQRRSSTSLLAMVWVHFFSFWLLNYLSWQQQVNACAAADLWSFTCVGIICWVTFLIAEACLLAGSVRNAYHTKYRTYFSDHPPSCETLRKGVFGAGAAFVIFTGIVSQLFYVSYSKAADGFLLQIMMRPI